MAESTCNSEFHSCAAFSTGTLLRDGRIAKRQFCALQFKDQLRDSCNYLNQKMLWFLACGFYLSINKCSKLGQKSLAHFVSFFVYALLHIISYAPRLPNKRPYYLW